MGPQERVIWKYPLARQDTQRLTLPCGAELLTVQMQGEQLMLWALVNPHGIPATRAIAILGTDERDRDEGVSRAQYIGTVQESRGMWYVWHVFDMGEA